jgi:hypothetical protein
LIKRWSASTPPPTPVVDVLVVDVEVVDVEVVEPVLAFVDVLVEVVVSEPPEPPPSEVSSPQAPTAASEPRRTVVTKEEVKLRIAPGYTEPTSRSSVIRRPAAPQALVPS